MSLTVTDTRGWLRVTWYDTDSEVVSITLDRLNEFTPVFQVPMSMIGKSSVNAVFDMGEQIKEIDNGNIKLCFTYYLQGDQKVTRLRFYRHKRNYE